MTADAEPSWLVLLPFAITVVAVLVVTLLLWRGLRLLLWPFRALLASVRASASGLHSAAYLVALVLAVVIVPGPFNYLIEMFVELVRLLAIELPMLILTTARNTLNTCASGSSDPRMCAATVMEAIAVIWNGPIGAWFSHLRIPPLWDWALFVFVLCLGSVWFVMSAASPLQRFGSSHSSTRPPRSCFARRFALPVHNRDHRHPGVQ